MSGWRAKIGRTDRRSFGWSEPSHWGAVEIGSSKVVVLTAEITGGRINITGFGEARSRGVRRGAVEDYATAGECVGRALAEAERSSGLRLSKVFVALSGAHVEGDSHVGLAMAGGLDGRISVADVAQAHAATRLRELPAGRCVLHHFPGAAELDGAPAVEPVAGRRGECLRVRAWRLHARAARVADTLHLLRSLGLEPAQVVFSGLASAWAATETRERAAGVLTLDLGAGLTNYVLHRRGVVTNAGVLAVGGDQVSRDLSVGLGLRFEEAEALKRLHGRARVLAHPSSGARTGAAAGMELGKRTERGRRVWLDENRGVGARNLSLTAIEQVSSARAREALELVRRKLGSDYRPERVTAGVVLTGGAARLAGLVELAAEVFEAPARLGVPGEGICGPLREPDYSTVVGTLAAGWELQTHMPPPVRRWW